MTGLLPVGLDLASVAVTLLSGKATKTPPELLGTQTDAVSASITNEVANLDLPQLSDGFAGRGVPVAGADDLAALVGEGLSAASFVTSGAHTDYHDLVVDNAGRTATAWLADWLTLQIGRAT